MEKRRKKQVFDKIAKEASKESDGNSLVSKRFKFTEIKDDAAPESSQKKHREKKMSNRGWKNFRKKTAA